jgi:hypothetical protein
MEAPEQLLNLLAMAGELPGSSGSQEAAAEASDPSLPAASQAAAGRQRSHDQGLAAVGQLLKSAANSPAAGAAVWGLLGRWYALRGELLSSQEAALKQVSSLLQTHFAMMCFVSTGCVAPVRQ